MQSRFPASGTERLPFPPRPHEKAPENPSIFPEPRPNDRAYGARDELVGDHAGGTRGAVAKRDDALREVTTLFLFLGLCVNDCGWCLSVEVELFKCCRVSGLVGTSLLPVIVYTCHFLTWFCFTVLLL